MPAAEANVSAQNVRRERAMPRWFVGLCRWCWRQRGFFWGTLIIGVGANVFAAWLFTPFGANYRNLPIGWAFQHPAVFVALGLFCLMFSCIALLGGRYEAAAQALVAPSALTSHSA